MTEEREAGNITRGDQQKDGTGPRRGVRGPLTCSAGNAVQMFILAEPRFGILKNAVSRDLRFSEAHILHGHWRPTVRESAPPCSSADLL